MQISSCGSRQDHFEDLLRYESTGTQDISPWIVIASQEARRSKNCRRIGNHGQSLPPTNPLPVGPRQQQVQGCSIGEHIGDCIELNSDSLWCPDIGSIDSSPSDKNSTHTRSHSRIVGIT